MKKKIKKEIKKIIPIIVNNRNNRRTLLAIICYYCQWDPIIANNSQKIDPDLLMPPRRAPPGHRAAGAGAGAGGRALAGRAPSACRATRGRWKTALEARAAVITTQAVVKAR
jgi:hypothetical protein